jgi:hypothetical protein
MSTRLFACTTDLGDDVDNSMVITRRRGGVIERLWLAERTLTKCFEKRLFSFAHRHHRPCHIVSADVLAILACQLLGGRAVRLVLPIRSLGHFVRNHAVDFRLHVPADGFAARIFPLARCAVCSHSSSCPAN